MALIDDVRLAVRVTSTAYDSELTMLIEAAFQDMVRVGIDPAYLDYGAGVSSDPPSLVRHAVICYVKANFGYDNDDAERFDKSYRQIVCDLLNSERNLASSVSVQCNCSAN